MLSLNSLRSLALTGMTFVAFAAVSLFSGAAPGQARPTYDGAVYTISNASSGNTVIAFNRAWDGALTQDGTFETGGLGTGGNLGSQGAVMLSQNGRYLLVVNGGSDNISLFSVRPNGLTLLDVEPCGGTTPIGLAIHGNVAYVVNDGSDNIAGFTFNKHGLSPIAGSLTSLPLAPAAPGEVAFTPDGHNLVVTLKDKDTIVTYPLHDDLPGAPETFTTVASTPFGFAVDSRGRAVVSEAVGDLSSYQVARNGDVSLISGPVSTGQAAPCWVVLSNNERFAFTTNAAAGTISSYNVARDGTLSLIASVAGTAGQNPLDMAISRDGRFLYAVNRLSGTVSGFRIGYDGQLTSLGSFGSLPAGSVFGLAAS